ncbi:TlpA disulfide reductase family protein [Roseibium sp. HPY-6]|uniref:TlpA family protein disulfide reductase n=1 Tax=Roseibium sp. HPY-6 TaxID=3229852 RepID=UPI00338FC28C
MRSSLVTFLVIIGSFVAVANIYPILFPTELPIGRIAMLETPRELPNAEFTDQAGVQVDLKAFEGSYVFVNVWATWCEPCREEMPALDQLSRELRGDNIKVLPISIDVNGAGAIERFYKRHELTDLPVYMDPAQNIMRALNVVGIPTTVLIGPDGRELGRMVGPAQWDRPETVRQLQEIAGS